MAVKDTASPDEFSQLTSGTAAVHFWASWCEPCVHMDAVFAQLARDYPSVTFLRVEAEVADAISEKFEIPSVPYFLLFRGGQLADRLEGADTPGLTAKVKSLGAAPSPSAAAAAAAAASNATYAAAQQQKDLKARIAALVNGAPVMLFMKGSPGAPKCGFSRKVVEALNDCGAEFGHFDILADEAVRQGLKEYSDWPTYPQLFSRGELVGGCDIVLAMASSGELKAALAGPEPGEPQAPPAGPPPVRERIEALLKTAKVLLFMKGTPEAPKCGFSRRVVDALRECEAPFATFDILGDEEIRQGLKEFSDWPTFPQLYVSGELLGGCDIITEMASKGELKAALAA